jgi:hypothetical protein
MDQHRSLAWRRKMGCRRLDEKGENCAKFCVRGMYHSYEDEREDTKRNIAEEGGYRTEGR